MARREWVKERLLILRKCLSSHKPAKVRSEQASDATIMSISGHLSRKMMEQYSHVRNEAKRDAIHALEDVARISIVGQFPDCQ